MMANDQLPPDLGHYGDVCPYCKGPMPVKVVDMEMCINCFTLCNRNWEASKGIVTVAGA